MTDDAMTNDAGEVQEPHASPPVPEDLDMETPDKSAFAAVRDKLRKKAITGLSVLIPSTIP